MSTENLGNKLNSIVKSAMASLFEQGELAQLTYGAFDIAVKGMQSSELEEIEVTFPVGYRPDKTAIPTIRKYRKEELLGRYQFLAFHQLSVNGLVQLVTIIEAMLGDIVRAVTIRYPQKIGSKRTVSLQVVLESTSVEEIHVRATDALLNELAYKSPLEFAESLAQLLSINLMECPAYHRYIEVKATRDIFIHNRGIANEIYVRKAGLHARVKSGQQLPADIQYFLESYESCLQIAEWLEKQLHDKWHSSDYEARETTQLQMPLPSAGVTPPALT